MPIIKLSGGLGNQLFQVALAIAISKSTGRPVGLDTAFYRLNSHENGRYLEVKEFTSEHFYFYDSTKVSTKFAKKILPRKFFIKYFQKSTQSEMKRGEVQGLPIQIESNAIYDIQVDLKKDSYFIGSFISPEYWGEETEYVLETIRRLTTMYFPSPKNCIETELAIHVRRGDYISNSKARKFHGICGFGYYLATVRQMLEAFPNIQNIQIFSDEIRFAEDLQELLEAESRSIRINQNSHAPTAMAEMSCSKYFIGCNSTFSWWASVLNNSRHSILPLNWFLDSRRVIDAEKFFVGDIQVFENELE